MDLETVVLIVVAAGVGGWVGWKASAAFHQDIFADMLERLNVSDDDMRKMANEMAEEAGVEGIPEPDVDAIEIRIEKHNDTLYAYRKDTEEFLGQGADKDALLARLVLQFPTGARLVLTDDDGAALIKE